MFFNTYSNTILKNMANYEVLTDELNKAWKKLNEGDCNDAWAELLSNVETERGQDEADYQQLQYIMNHCEAIDEVDALDSNTPNTSGYYSTQNIQTLHLEHQTTSKID